MVTRNGKAGLMRREKKQDQQKPKWEQIVPLFSEKNLLLYWVWHLWYKRHLWAILSHMLWLLMACRPWQDYDYVLAKPGCLYHCSYFMSIWLQWCSHHLLRFHRFSEQGYYRYTKWKDLLFGIYSKWPLKSTQVVKKGMVKPVVNISSGSNF